MSQNVETAIADLKLQFERAITPWQEPDDDTDPVQVEHSSEGQWLFWLHIRNLVECKLVPPRALWLANKRISTKALDLCLVGARYKGEQLLVLVETKHFNAQRSGPHEFDWSLPAFSEADLLADPVRKIAAKRSLRALLRVFRNATAHAVEEAASQTSDLEVVVRALEQPDAIESLKQDDPLAAARLRGLRERERLLSDEGGTWSVERVAKHLQLTRQAINRRRKQDALLGLDAGRHGYRYPAWQFARTGTIKGLEQVLAALEQVDPWMRQAFMLGRSGRLKEQRAIDVLRSGDVASVVKAASAFGEHGAA